MPYLYERHDTILVLQSLLCTDGAFANERSSEVENIIHLKTAVIAPDINAYESPDPTRTKSPQLDQSSLGGQAVRGRLARHVSVRMQRAIHMALKIQRDSAACSK